MFIEMCMLQVHERTLQGDFLMALLKDLVVSRRTTGNPLKVTPRCCCHLANLLSSFLLHILSAVLLPCCTTVLLLC